MAERTDWECRTSIRLNTARWTDGSDDTLDVSLVRDQSNGKFCIQFQGDTAPWLTMDDIDDLIGYLQKLCQLAEYIEDEGL